MAAVIVRRIQGPLEITTPYRAGNRTFLAALAPRPDLTYLGSGKWTIRRSLFRAAVPALADRFGRLEVITYGCATQRCDSRCAEAQGWDCVCACASANHGAGTAGWVQIGDTQLVPEGLAMSRFLVKSDKSLHLAA